MIYSFGGYTPVVHESAFVHPQAAVTGNVIIGKGKSGDKAACHDSDEAGFHLDRADVLRSDSVSHQEYFPHSDNKGVRHHGGPDTSGLYVSPPIENAGRCG